MRIEYLTPSPAERLIKYDQPIPNIGETVILSDILYVVTARTWELRTNTVRVFLDYRKEVMPDKFTTEYDNALEAYNKKFEGK